MGDDRPRHNQREQKIAVSLFAKFAPRLGDRAAILDDAIDEHESTSRA
jgi:hypothetical protein